MLRFFGLLLLGFLSALGADQLHMAVSMDEELCREYQLQLGQSYTLDSLEVFQERGYQVLIRSAYTGSADAQVWLDCSEEGDEGERKACGGSSLPVYSYGKTSCRLWCGNHPIDFTFSLTNE